LKRWLRYALRIALAGLVVLTLVIAAEIAIGWRCHPDGQIPFSETGAPAARVFPEIKGYARPEDDTFLSYPEWYIVWSYQEKADFQEHHLPSGFPFFGSVRQYWTSYCCISRLIRGRYPFNAGEQLMLVVIGTSFSAEYILKGVYEKTIGRVTEWSSNYESTDEDRFAYRVARDYADFVHIRPFYEFHFATRAKQLWVETPAFGRHPLRKWERRLFLTADYGIEGVYCWVIEKLTHLTYGIEPSTTYASILHATPGELAQVPDISIVRQLGPIAFAISGPRYQPFTMKAVELASRGIDFNDIAGNSQILLSVLVPNARQQNTTDETVLFSTPILTDPRLNRAVIVCHVRSLSNVLRGLGADEKLEHIYDY
jgi:hypothetical protein